jgi:hypothetical protein
MLDQILTHRTAAEDRVAERHTEGANAAAFVQAFDEVDVPQTTDVTGTLAIRIAASGLVRALDAAEYSPNFGLMLLWDFHHLLLQGSAYLEHSPKRRACKTLRSPETRARPLIRLDFRASAGIISPRRAKGGCGGVFPGIWAELVRIPE